MVGREDQNTPLTLTAFGRLGNSMTLLLGFVLAATCLATDALAEEDLPSLGVNFTEPMIACFDQRKVYWGAKNECHELPNRAVCPLNQWLVLDAERMNSDDRLEPRCKAIPCKILHVHWPASGSCLKMTTKNVCPEGNKIRDDLYGDGICDCKKYPVHLPMNLSIEATKCYELYTQGPCPVGEVLVAQHIKKKGHIAVCQKDPCAQYRKENNIKGAVALHSESNQCSTLNKVGPCTGSTVFQVAPPSYLPGCRSSNQLSIISNVPRRCLTSGSDNHCDKPVHMGTETRDSFMWDQETANSRKIADAS